ncbi:MAG TPA: DUF4845 domain-containing protein [Burkholderiales bacterium]|nr:DUF4845 domain-containing protein [Burkholderiales bacterium]
MGRQRGVTLTGMILVSIVVLLLMLVAFKIVPVYIEYFAIEKQFKAMAADPKLRNPTRGQILTSWAARSAVDDLRSLDPNLIEVTREANGILVEAEYSVKVPLFRNVAACFDFHPSSK